jgi:RNA polymerase sigma-70 factor (ECF subfamily)
MIDPAELERHRTHIYWLCYRMTGVAADAEDLVQETFVRALESPPRESSREILPWLVRVALNVSRDLLRRRKTRGYVGPWLPSPVDTESLPAEGLSPSAHYSQVESLSFAFLIALEALSTTQRAVLLLRDVLDYSVEETAQALSLSVANVKTSHHRARALLGSYDQERPCFDAQSRANLQGAMTRLFAYLAMDDIAAARGLLSDAAIALNDGGGEFFAALRPVTPAARVLRFMHKTMQKSRLLGFAPRVFNGLPAMVTEFAPYIPEVARYSAHVLLLDREGRIARVYSVLATRKLAHLSLATQLSPSNHSV